MNKPLVVIINGMPGSGKDTFVEGLKSICDCNSIVVDHKDRPIHSFFWIVSQYHGSDLQKEALKMLGWDGEKTPDVRDLLAYLIQKSDKMFDCTNNYFDTSVQNQEEYCDGLNDNRIPYYKPLIFLHVREPERIDKYKEKYNAVTLLMRRGSNVKCSNDSDCEHTINGYDYDFVIDNKGNMGDLLNSINKFFWDISAYYVKNRYLGI